MKLFVFEYTSFGDWSFAVMAESLDAAVAAILKCEDNGWTREELQSGLYEIKEYEPMQVASFSN